MKNLFLKTTLTLLLLSPAIAEDSAFMKQQMQGFNDYKASQEKEFQQYKDAQDKAFKEYKKEIGAVWEEPKLSTKKSWVSYAKDKKTRSDVDFANETITVETIASSPKEAEAKLKQALAKAVTIDTSTVQKTDPLEVRLDRISKPAGVVDKPVKSEPILSTIIFKSKPTVNSVKKYINSKITNSNMRVTKASKVKHAKVYSVSVKMPKHAMLKRSKIYSAEITKQAKRQKLPKSLIYAIMHSESNFNPRARSHIPAYGLMQIVPKTAGIDSYKYLYKKKKLVSSRYLYDSQNNIIMGSAYLHILYYRYLKKIKNPDSRLYCTIAAYNTGAGNIAYAFTRKYNMHKAAPLINKLSPEQVKAKLLKDLRWDEPKHYLKKVSKRMSAYHKVYGD